MKLKSLLLLFLLSVQFLTAGEIQFDLSTYEPVEYKTTKLSLLPSVTSLYKDSLFYTIGSFSQVWSLTRSYDIRLQDFSFDNMVTILTSKQTKGALPEYRQTRILNNHTVSYEHRKYKKPEKFFLQSNSNIMFSHGYYFKEGKGYEDKSHNLTSAQSLGLGFGRIKDVTFPAVCLQAFRTFQQSGQLRRKSPENIHQVSQLFEQLKKERSWDWRKTRIKQIKDITTYLYSEGITSPLNPEQLMEFLDIWEFGFTQERKHGHEFHFSANIKVWDLINELKDQNARSISKSPLIENQYFYETTTTLIAQFEIHRSPSLKHTRSLYFEIMWGNGEKSGSLSSLSIQPSLSFYPTLRSTISLSNLFTHYIANNNRGEFNNYNDDYTSITSNTFNATFNYFVRPQLSYTGKWDLIYESDDMEDNTFHEFQFGMTYHIK